MNLHLSHEQLCDIIFADLSSDTRLEQGDSSDVVHEHLRACPICSAELKSLRDSLTLFRDASVSYAHKHFVHSHLRSSSIAPRENHLSQPLYWAAAVLILVAALFPLSMRHSEPLSPVRTSAAISLPAAVQPQPESDAALLADIDQTISDDVPAPLEALADPTVDSPTSSTSARRKN